ncbi:MAG: hypothetical protein ABSF45_16380 [Terriglobia bacterium]|jgi:hypothetical protein
MGSQLTRQGNGLGFPIMQQARLLPQSCLKRWTRIKVGHVQPGGSAHMPSRFTASHFHINGNGNMDIACREEQV